ncbi:hypothetical protein ACVIGB_000614 [Bradyrhizobium sp. USDA 4341]
MTKEMKLLLEWLLSGPGQYGECHGKTLDDLIERGWVVVNRDGDQSGFIAKGADLMHCPVEITAAGRASLEPELQSAAEVSDVLAATGMG